MNWLSLRFLASCFLALGLVSATPLRGDETEAGSHGLDFDPAPVLELLERRGTTERRCAAVIADLHTYLGGVLLRNHEEFLGLKERVLKDRDISEPMFNQLFRRLADTVLFYKERLLLSREIDGTLAFDNFLYGVCLWAESYEDLEFAIGVFERQIGRSGKRSNPKPANDLDLEFFAARMLWMVDRYEGDPDRDRDRAANSVDEFDEHAVERLRMYWDLDSGEVSIATLNESPPRIQRVFGIRIPSHPVTPLGLRFNNGRQFPIKTVSMADVWALKYLQGQEPDEHLLGFGDTSVRQFFRIFRVIEGYVVISPYVADFLSAVKTRSGWGLILREMKFANPDNATVDVSHALEQLQSSWAAIHERHGANPPVIGLELVVPRRSARLQSGLGNGYSIGNQIPGFDRTDVRQLLLNGTNVELQVNGKTLPVYVRQLPLTQEQWKQITAQDKEKRRH